MRMKAGRKFRDGLGRVWTVESDGLLTLEDGADEAWMFSAVEGRYGPVEEVHGTPASPPDYYQFPGGVQVIDISRHLTSNAGQAVQYLARSSRIDGVNKDDPVRDLMKARDMILDEIARLGGQNTD